MSEYGVPDTKSMTISREDTNAKLLLHVENAVQNGHQNVVVLSNDYNVIIVSLYAYKYLQPNIDKFYG